MDDRARRSRSSTPLSRLASALPLVALLLAPPRAGAGTAPLRYQPASLPREIAVALAHLSEEYPLRELRDGHTPGPGEILLRFESDPSLAGATLARAGAAATIRHGDLPCALRAVGSLLAGLAADGGTRQIRPAFVTRGILLDCGHNATVRPDHFRKWLRRLALLGYNMAMLYTEAGYALEGEPAFGYMRGGYRPGDLRALDRYAADLGIEMVGAIQALGHLEQLLKWPPYTALRDTEHTLLAGDPRVAALVEKMVAHWADVFRSRRLHLGMDETYDLGRGRHLDRNGYRPGLEIYAEHLALACATCKRHGLRPMIWSDVLFKLANVAGGHYDKASRPPADLAATLPPELDLVYWDYYSPDKKHYLDRIAAHRALGREPVMASGIWSWPNFWHDWDRTSRNAGACIDACREARLEEVLFALWSDDGAFWELDSNLAGVTLAAERCFDDGAAPDDRVAARFRAVCGSDLAPHRIASGINSPLQSCDVIWDDPLQAMYLRKVAARDPGALAAAARHYAGIARALEPHAADRAAGDLRHARIVARALEARVDLASRLFHAYATRDRAALAATRDAIPDAIARIEELAESTRALWLERCEPFGLEVLQIRFAGSVARHRELARRIGDLLDGAIAAIPELDEGAKGAFTPSPGQRYRSLASGARVF